MTIIKAQADKATHNIVEEGIHRSVLTQVKEFENHWGDRFGFEFTIQDTGETLLRTTTTKLTPKSKLAELLSGITGAVVGSTTEIDLESLVGKECDIVVKQGKGKNGQLYSNIEHVVPVRT